MKTNTDRHTDTCLMSNYFRSLNVYVYLVTSPWYLYESLFLSDKDLIPVGPIPRMVHPQGRDCDSSDCLLQGNHVSWGLALYYEH